MEAESVEEVELIIDEKMQKTCDNLQKEFSSVHAGRATPTMLDPVRVDYYGTPTPISQLGAVSVPESQLIVVNPWDKSLLKEIERGILKANLGFSISNDGNVLRITLPPFTEERRRELVKQIKKMSEDAKIALRNIRREGNEQIKKMEKEKEISKDEAKKSLDVIQSMINEYVVKVEKATGIKEKELMTI